MRYYLLLIVFLAVSCSEERKASEIINTHRSLTLVAFGPAEVGSKTKLNKGFSPSYYFYIDLDTDSVLVRTRNLFEEPSLTQIKTGHIKNISSDSSVIAAKRILDYYRSGTTITNLSNRDSSQQGPILYCGFDYFLEYKNGSESRFVYTNAMSIKELYDLHTHLRDAKELMDVSDKITLSDDTLIIQIVNRKEFSRTMRPPPAIVRRIDFVPPKVFKN